MEQAILLDAIKAAICAGEEILAIYNDPRQDFQIEQKADNSPLTIADRKAHEVISSYLQKTPYPILSEEGKKMPYEERSSWNVLWIVDPLDGTNNYSQGLPIFTVSLGLQKGGETLLGVVYAPYLDELYVGVKGVGAWLNGRMLRVAQKRDLAHSVLCTGFPYDKDVNPDNNAANLAAILPYIRGVRRQGSAAYDLCCVAAGWLDGYWELALNLWDICAAALIVEEAGGVVERFRENRGISIVAGNTTIVEKIREKIH
jgi:fructose-1,6-bisphosphatase/inositol monophosphatase family enzyme